MRLSIFYSSSPLKVIQRSLLLTLLLAVLPLVNGCLLGPDYLRPEIDTPDGWKEVRGESGSRLNAIPADELPKGRWWEIYDDSELNRLQQEATLNNQDLRAAMARLEQAGAAARVAGAAIMPTLDLQADAQRGASSADLTPGGASQTGTTINLPLNLAYELDLWGRLRRQSEAAGADFAASAAELESFRLLLHSEVARSYFTLQTLEREVGLLSKTLELRRKNQKMMNHRYQLGIGNRLDLSRAQTETATSEAELITLQQQRSEMEHALALLLGAHPAELELSKGEHLPTPPPLQPGLPAELLLRRPDVAAAERKLKAANARIGMAEAAFFPGIRLTGAAGFGSTELSTLLNSGNSFWNLGPQLSLPIFDGGANQARLDQAGAAHREALAGYQQTILQAFREVEDALSALYHLENRHRAQTRALEHASEGLELARRRYQGGLVSYFEVIESERSHLGLQRALLNTKGQQLQAHIALVKALGGGFQEK